jgi:hypothetical protein
MARNADEEAVQGIKDTKARKEAYYTRQRQNASAGSATQKKIQGKLNWGDEVRGFAKDQMQKIKASGPYSIPGARTEEGAAAGVKALGAGVSNLAKRGEGAMEEAVQHLRKPTPVKKALSSSQVKTSSKGPHTEIGKAPAKPSAISAAKNHSITSSAKPGAKAVGGQARKALGTSGQGEWHAEVAKQSSKKMPSNPKTFNRNGTPRAEGRQKSTRNPVSKRTTAKSKHMDEWSK